MLNSRALMSGLCGLMCLGILSSMLVLHALPLWTGTDIFLRVVPVDPRDLFRGDYVVLTYDVSRLYVGDPSQEPVESGDERIPMTADWWDDLDPDQLIHYQIKDQEVRVRLVPEPVDLPGVPVAYKATSVGDSGDIEDGLFLRGLARQFSGGYLTIHYGIDALYVQEGTGPDIEQAIRDRKPVYAVIAVTGSGRARLRDLIIDGRRVLTDR